MHTNSLSDSESYLHKPVLSQEVIQFIMRNFLKNDTILELGCGGGHLSDFLNNNSYTRVLSSDISIVALRCAGTKYPSLKFICLDAQNMAIKDNSLDVVIGVEMIEHLPDILNHLSEVNRVLKKRGAYIIKTPNKWIDIFYYRFLFKIEASKSHVSLCSFSDLNKLLKKNGFSPIFLKQTKLTESQIRKVYLVLPNPIAFFLIRCIDTVLKYLPLQFNLSLICIAKKD